MTTWLHAGAVVAAFGVLVCRARHVSPHSVWTIKVQYGQLMAAVLGTLLVPPDYAVTLLCGSVAGYFLIQSMGPAVLRRRQQHAEIIQFASGATRHRAQRY